MRVNGSSDSCSGNSLVDLSEPRDWEVTWAPVTGVTVSGAGLALLAAALLYACHRKLLISAPVSRLCAHVFVLMFMLISFFAEELGENMLLQIMMT